MGVIIKTRNAGANEEEKRWLTTKGGGQKSVRTKPQKTRSEGRNGQKRRGPLPD